MKTVAQTVIEADRFYTIAAKTGNVIQAVEDVKNGGDIRLGKYEHKPEQEWTFIRVGDGVYRIRNRANGKLIDLMMTGTANGTWLHLWEDVGGTSQMWTIVPSPDGTVRLRSSWAGGRCIDTVGMGAEAGAVLQVWQEVAGGNDQLWTISEVKDRAKRASKKEEPAETAVTEAKPKKTTTRKKTTKAAEAKSETEAAAPSEEKKPAAKKPRKTAAKKAEPAVNESLAEKAAASADKTSEPAEAVPADAKPKRTPRKKAAK